MKLEVKQIDEVKRELSFEIPKERVQKKMDEVYKDMAKVAKIKGYRQGKVPRNILEAHHGKEAQEETIKKLIPEVYHEGLEKEKINPIDMPSIENVSYKDGVIKFLAKLEIKPDIKIKEYKGIKVKRKDTKVTQEDIDKTLEFIKTGQGKDKEAKIDDEFARGMGYPNLEEFKKSLSRQLEMDKDRHNRADIENQIMDALLKKTKLTAPETLVNKQLEHRLQESINRLKSQGIPAEDLKKREEDMRKELQDSVEKDVKIYLILDKIAELENITIKEGESMPAKVVEFLLKEAKWEGGKLRWKQRAKY